jgi:uncharacterized protein (DUF1501 family)
MGGNSLVVAYRQGVKKMVLFRDGGRIKGGLVGTHPSLTDLDKGALKMHTDFRQVYATMLDRWLGFASEPVLGGRFESLDVLKA